MSHATWTHPFANDPRAYASAKMRALLSDDAKFETWRKLWLNGARCQRQLGLAITEGQIAEMETHLKDPIKYDHVAELEVKKRHDVMAHLAYFGELCPAAAPIMHQGFTSCTITDNADLLLHRETLELVEIRLARGIDRLMEFARRHWGLVILGATHYQAAEPVTLGKRACLWIQDLLADLRNIRALSSALPFLGAKGATGTQGPLLTLFNGDKDRVLEFDRLFAESCGFVELSPLLAGQTYSRKIDANIISALAALGSTLARISNDLRLMAHDYELQEPRTEDQVGSSAMAFKRNPMLAERLRAIARWLMGMAAIGQQMYADQWLERTLDDSATRRILIPETYLAADACLLIAQYLFEGASANTAVIAANVRRQLPFLATSEVLAAATRAGLSRQTAHEHIRVLSMEAWDGIFNRGEGNNLLERIKDNPFFAPIKDQVDSLAEPNVGLAPDQVAWFITGTVEPALAMYRDNLDERVTLNF